MKDTAYCKLLYKVFSKRQKTVSLYDYSGVIDSPDDVTNVCAELDDYIGKYSDAYFEYSLSTGTIVKRNIFLTPMVNEIRKLKPLQFEKLSAIICKCMGYENFYATQASNDQGIDFIAYSDFEHFKFDHKQFVIGQSKHFGNKLVKTEEIRGLAGSVFLFARREFSLIKSIYSKHILNSFTPINVVFMTSYFLSKPAIRLCGSASIIPLDIIDIVCICLKGINDGILKWVKDGKFSRTNFLSDIKNVEIER